MTIGHSPQAALSLSWCREGRLSPASDLPWLVEPRHADVDLADELRRSHVHWQQRLDTVGALLFRNFELASDEGLGSCARALCATLVEDYGDLPHTSTGEGVYAATPYPKQRRILYHNEASHSDRWPTKQFFFCPQPAETGGETPLVDCVRLYTALPRAIVDDCERKGLRYIRNFIPGLDVSWQDFFGASDRAAVEARCTAVGLTCEWIGHDRLRTTRRSVARLGHPATGVPVFFNQILLHHPALLDAALRRSLTTLYGEDGFPRNVTFGDGSPITADVVQTILTASDAIAVAFPWQRGDLLVVDNIRVSHGRNAYTGNRVIRVAMGDPMMSPAAD